MKNREKKLQDHLLMSVEGIVHRVIYQGAYINILINTDVDFNKLDFAARKFASRVIYGTVENWILLNYILDKLATNPKKISKKLRVVLCIGLYILRFMDAKADGVVVNRIVEYVGSAGMHMKSTKGFVNWILREYIRRESENQKNIKCDAAVQKDIQHNSGIHIPDGDGVISLAVKYSHPTELVELFVSQFGTDETKRILEANNHNSTLTCRINSKKFSMEHVLEVLKQDGVDANINDLCDDAIDICDLNDTNIANLQAFEKGMIYVQDISSILHSKMLEIQKGASVLDLCAAPGGKSIGAIMHMDESNSLQICDISDSKLGLLTKNLIRLGFISDESLQMESKDVGLPDIRIKKMDSSIYNSDFDNKFDLVIADVPCSGLGVIRSRPEIRYAFSMSKMTELMQIQASILENAYRYVKDGGMLIYSTCTINTFENENQIRKFLSSHKDAVVSLECRKILQITNLLYSAKKRQIPNPTNLCSGHISQNMIKLNQSNLKTDGFFACKISKRKLE